MLAIKKLILVMKNHIIRIPSELIREEMHLGAMLFELAMLSVQLGTSHQPVMCLAGLGYWLHKRRAGPSSFERFDKFDSGAAVPMQVTIYTALSDSR